MRVDIQPFAEYAVAPYVGAWIETHLGNSKPHRCHVAPYVGAWIETDKTITINPQVKSHPTWVRGLKRVERADTQKEYVVAPYVGAWIETENLPKLLSRIESRTLRGCVD